MLGSTFTWRATSSWVDANPFVSGPLAIFSLLPALAILAAIDVRWPGALGIAATAATAILAFWWTFATSDSSTAVFVFYWGWVDGIPLAFGAKQLATVAGRRSMRSKARESTYRARWLAPDQSPLATDCDRPLSPPAPLVRYRCKGGGGLGS